MTAELIDNWNGTVPLTIDVNGKEVLFTLNSDGKVEITWDNLKMVTWYDGANQVQGVLPILQQIVNR
jgi:hypothetical protein